MNGGTETRLASQRVRAAVCAAMGDRIPEGFRPQRPPTAVVAAGAYAAEADASQDVDVRGIVPEVDADGTDHAGVQHDCDCLSRNLAALAADPPHVQGHAASCPVRVREYERLARLRRWQEAR